MKPYFLLSLTILIILSSCKNQKEEYRNCILKAANYQMIRGEKASHDELLSFCSQHDDYLSHLDVDEKGKNQLFLDSVILRIDNKELFEGFDNSELPEIPCGKEFVDLIDKKENGFSEEDADLNDVVKHFDYLFLKRELDCSILVDNISEVGDLFNKQVEVDSEGNISVHGNIFVEDRVYEGFSILVKIPKTYLNKIKERTGYTDGRVFQQKMGFKGSFIKTDQNQLNNPIFVFETDSVEFTDV